MNREQAKALLPVITAFAEGKEVQCICGHPTCGWEDTEQVNPYDYLKYRIKPEPKWRPWKASEVPKVVVTIPKDTPENTATWPTVEWGFGLTCDKVLLRRFGECLWLHEDGTTTPCGVLEP
jgi:hypothetical protein